MDRSPRSDGPRWETHSRIPLPVGRDQMSDRQVSKCLRTGYVGICLCLGPGWVGLSSKSVMGGIVHLGLKTK